MKKSKNRFIRSLSQLTRNLFGFGGMNKEPLEEEQLTSPFFQVLKKFIRNKLSIVGLFIFVAIILFVVIGNMVIDFIPEEKETTQIALAPGRSQLKVPSALKKVGVKKSKSIDSYLIGGGVSFTVAVGQDEKIYVWGTNTNDIKKVPESIQNKAAQIAQIAVGSTHVMVLFEDGRISGWGKNTFEQAQIPHYEAALDSALPHKKTIEAYFDPTKRVLYASDVVTTIEEDPIVQVAAGYEYTSILTRSGRVYTWGNTKANELSEGFSSFNYLRLRGRIFEDKIQVRYSGRNHWLTLMTKDEAIDHFHLPSTGKPLELRFFADALEYRLDSSSPWIFIASIDTLTINIEKIKIEKIKATNEIIGYFFSDGSCDLVGLEGIIRSNIPSLLYESTVERGFEITDIAVLKSNAFALTSTGVVFGWGEYNKENNLIDIPGEVMNKSIQKIDGGVHHIVAIDNDGFVYTWASNNRKNQLKMPPKLSHIQAVQANYFNGLAVDSKGMVRIWGHKGYFFGTDLVGADIFSRVIAGGSTTLLVAAVAVLVSLMIGLLVGLVAGFYGGWIDNLLMRFGEIISAFPFLPLAMTLAKIVEDRGVEENTRIVMIMIILGFLSWPGLARLIRGQILAEREKDFILASKALGIRERHIILRHIFPNVVNVVIVSTTLSYAGTLLTEAGLSYLNFGVKYPRPSWGNLLNSAQKMVVLEQYWWMWIIPAFFLIATALSVNLVGDGLREAMDPKSNER